MSYHHILLEDDLPMEPIRETQTHSCFFLKRWWAAFLGWCYVGYATTPQELVAWRAVSTAQANLEEVQRDHANQITNLEILHTTAMEAVLQDLQKARAEIDRLTKDIKIAEDEREASKAGLELLAETLERYKNLEAMKSVLYRRRAGIDQPRSNDL